MKRERNIPLSFCIAKLRFRGQLVKRLAPLLKTGVKASIQRHHKLELEKYATGGRLCVRGGRFLSDEQKKHPKCTWIAPFCTKLCSVLQLGGVEIYSGGVV